MAKIDMAYRNVIGTLAYKTAHGDLRAERKLEKELRENKKAASVLRWLIRRDKVKCYEPKSGPRRKDKTADFKQYKKSASFISGGLPSLGKKRR
ncbi:hypothetical protein [Sansalvadorimonas verongulae]|uniref:hypothetical protein n=1 Tax=Sansalvadorimonas verongulae TaxID=2172824 RepID=UPI0012BBF364|nr:hypothetical protein [Sansalvadorimonas verongulae]MTI15081.1 hypothetical protein [Sansalvadorimonas verongulae]